MKALILFFFFSLFAATLCLASDNFPVTTPVEFKGLDTLSKLYHHNVILNNKEKKQDRILTPDYVTDPRVVFSTYFGGNGYDCINSVAVDKDGFIYFTGYTGSTDLLTIEDAFQKEKKGGHDAFVAKFDDNGQPLWITYMGGSKTDVGVDCVVDKDGNLIIAGKTDSPDFPVTDGSFFSRNSDIFLTKFNPDGKLLWSKFYGDTSFEAPEAIALTPEGDFVITGYTTSPHLPTTKGAFQEKYTGLDWRSDAFVAKFNGDGDIVWWTYLGGDRGDVAHGIAVSASGDIAVTGEVDVARNTLNTRKFPVTDDAFQKDSIGFDDAFMTVFDSDGKLKYSTLFGGEYFDRAYDIKFDSQGNIYFTGVTWSEHLPVTDNAFDKEFGYVSNIMLVKFNKNYKLEFSTYFGGDSIGISDFPTGDDAYSMDIDNNNNIWITGKSANPNFPTTNDAIYRSNSQARLFIITEFNSNGYPLWSTKYKGYQSYGNMIRIAPDNKIIIGGETEGIFPVTKGAFQEDKQPLPNENDGALFSIDLNKNSIETNKKDSDIVFYIDESDKSITAYTNSGSEVIQSAIITDLLGRQVFRNFQVNEVQTRISLKDLPVSPSIYFITVTTNKKTQTYKFIY